MNIYNGWNRCKTLASALIIALLSFTPFIHAQSAPGDAPFDHNRTGYLLRGVHTTLQCEQCHVNGIFKNTPKDCGGCHAIGSRVRATPKPVNHVPSNNSCESCHNSPSSFLVKSFSHAGLTSNCASCHSGQFLGVTGKSANHTLTSLPCENCHNNPTTFTGARMDHTGITSGCASCHSKPAVHVATAAACETCHTQSNTSNFSTFMGASYRHLSSATGTCTTCHMGQYPGVVSLPANHFPTAGAQCDLCHTATNTSGYISFLGASYVHASPAGTCATCHNGATAKGKSATHVPTSAACDSCHTNTANYTTFLGASYTHSNPAGTCSTCHNGIIAAGKLSTHVITTAACDVCHTNTANYTTFLGANYVHDSPPGTCSTCHNGVTALGKSARHVLTTAACNTCHTQSNTSNYTTFLGGVYTHSTPPGTCTTCHDGVQAIGKPSYHSVTTAACDTCHTQGNTANYTTFLGAFTHVTPPGVCSTCHDGVQAKGMSANHVPTLAACDTCHTNTANYTTFLGATYTHSSPPGTCSTCHNGVIAKGKLASHVTTSAPCDTCHTQSNTSNYANFLNATYVHSSPPGTCSSCHNGVTALGKPTTHVVTTAACDLCHTQGNTSGYTTFLGATYTHSSPPGTCSACHDGVTAMGKPASHMVTAAICDSCHTQTNTSNYTTFLGATGMTDHSALAAGGCSTCHIGGQATSLSSGHIPTATISCDGCHLKYNGTSVITFASATMNHTKTTATRCDVCHNGGYVAQGTTGAQAKPIKHIPTTITGALDCTTCHNMSIAANAASMSWLTETMNHNGASGGGTPIYCVTCHLTGTTYLVPATFKRKSHNGTSTAKDCSRSSCHKPLGSKGTAYSAWK